MATDHTHTEASLQELFRKAPDQAIEILFRNHYAEICRAVIRVIPDAAIAEDIAQEVFFELWRKRLSLNITSSFGAYLRKAARNRSLNYLRDHKVVPQGEEKLPLSDGTFTDSNQELELQDLQQSIDRAINQLPDRCRLVFSLSRFEDMSYQEIAHHLDISVKTVENQISKALRLLREALGPYLSWFVGFITFIFSD